MEILDEGGLHKSMEGPRKTLDEEKIWKIFYEVFDDKYFKQSDVEFPKGFVLKFK